MSTPSSPHSTTGRREPVATVGLAVAGRAVPLRVLLVRAHADTNTQTNKHTHTKANERLWYRRALSCTAGQPRIPQGLALSTPEYTSTPKYRRCSLLPPALLGPFHTTARNNAAASERRIHPFHPSASAAPFGRPHTAAWRPRRRWRSLGHTCRPTPSGRTAPRECAHSVSLFWVWCAPILGAV